MYFKCTQVNSAPPIGDLNIAHHLIAWRMKPISLTHPTQNLQRVPFISALLINKVNMQPTTLSA